MKTLLSVLALSALMLVGCEDNDIDDDLDMSVASPGALEECPAECSSSKACCDKKAENVDMGAVSESGDKTCPYSGTSFGAVSEESKGCCSKK